MEKNGIGGFINGSYIGRNVKLSGDVIIHRTEISPDELALIDDDGKYFIEGGKKICELEIDGNIIARGKIVKKNGGFFFKVIDVNGGVK